MMSKFTYRIGAIFYGIWGLLHIPIGYSVYMGGLSLESGLVQGRVLQGGFYLGMAGLTALLISRWNWVNHPTAFWANVWLINIVDIGFLLFVQKPGYVSLSRGLPGLVTGTIGTIFMALGYFQRSKSFSIADR
jgi:hypothetical protein